MSRPPIKEVPLTCPRLSLHLCHRTSEHAEGFWLYDEDAGMNLALGEKTELTACVEAIQYWKNRALQSQKEYNNLRSLVNVFVENVSPAEDDD